MKEPVSSFQRNTWRRLRKNKGAVIGMVVIFMAVLIAATGYWIAPDHSPDANRMILEIGGKKPGFTQQFMVLKKERPQTSHSFFSRFISGKEDDYNYIPIQGFEKKSDSVIIQQYVDEDVKERVAFPARLPYRIETKTFPLGTDKYGRDILSRLLVGVRVSLSVGLITVIISLSVGVLL